MLYDELKWRGLIKDESDPEIKRLLNEEKVTFYIGTDPTGDSLHIGHLSSFLICKRLKEYGHKPIILVGGATGLIGDPKPDTERPMITKEEVEHNFNELKNQIINLFDCEVVNNFDWCKDVNFIDYLRDYGKYFNINYMLGKDIVARRLEEGITYTEFSYMIMQALDFLHLYQEKNCIMQVAGQDQWGNITAGIELIRKKIGKSAYAFTMPLVTKKDGTKFGKTNGKAIWLSKEKTTPYEMYQFFVNVEDEMVINYLKRFTFLKKEEIENIEKTNNETPHLRIAAKTLAYEVVKFVHGKAEADKAKKMSEEIFANNNMDNAPKVYIDIIKDDYKLTELLFDTNIVPSKSEGRRLIIQGGIKINNEKVNDPDYKITKDLFSDNKLIIHKGKKNVFKIIKK